MPIFSQRDYAKHRKAKGMSGGTRKAVQDALAAGRTVKTAEGKIDSVVADKMWLERTNIALVRHPALIDQRPRIAPIKLGANASPEDTAEITIPPVFSEREHVARLAALVSCLKCGNYELTIEVYAWLSAPNFPWSKVDLVKGHAVGVGQQESNAYRY